jgi:hypothetical protein
MALSKQNMPSQHAASRQSSPAPGEQQQQQQQQLSLAAPGQAAAAAAVAAVPAPSSAPAVTSTSGPAGATLLAPRLSSACAAVLEARALPAMRAGAGEAWRQADEGNSSVGRSGGGGGGGRRTCPGCRWRPSCVVQRRRGGLLPCLPCLACLGLVGPGGLAGRRAPLGGKALCRAGPGRAELS